MANKVTIAAIVVGIAVAATTAHQWGYLWEDDHLGRVASLVTIYSLIIAPVWYFFKKKSGQDDERETVTAGLVSELGGAIEGLDEAMHSDLKVVSLGKGKDVYFMNRILIHATYDSLVTSGRIVSVAAHLQQETHDVFRIIKDRNGILQEIRRAEDDNGAGKPRSIKRRYQRLGEMEEMLMRRIPPLLESLGGSTRGAS